MCLDRRSHIYAHIVSRAIGKAKKDGNSFCVLRNCRLWWEGCADDARWVVGWLFSITSVTQIVLLLFIQFSFSPPTRDISYQASKSYVKRCKKSFSCSNKCYCLYHHHRHHHHHILVAKTRKAPSRHTFEEVAKTKTIQTRNTQAQLLLCCRSFTFSQHEEEDKDDNTVKRPVQLALRAARSFPASPKSRGNCWLYVCICCCSSATKSILFYYYFIVMLWLTAQLFLLRKRDGSNCVCATIILAARPRIFRLLA